MTRTHSVFLTTCLAALALVLPVLAAAPASAASWSKIIGSHGAQLQGCRVPLENGWRIYVRLVNDSDHGHGAGITVNRDGKIVDRANFTVNTRRTSKVRSVVFRGGDELIGGIGEADSGEGHGGDFSLGLLVHC